MQPLQRVEQPNDKGNICTPLLVSDVVGLNLWTFHTTILHVELHTWNANKKTSHQTRQQPWPWLLESLWSMGPPGKMKELGAHS